MRRIANPSAIGETAVECRWPSWRRMSGDAVGRGRTVCWRWTRHNGHGMRRRAARATVAADGMTRISVPPGVSIARQERDRHPAGVAATISLNQRRRLR
jgi:hypothetical protein